jgi:toxin ParE1/3/4
MTKIQWSRLAIEDLQALRAHIGEHDAAAAKRLAEAIVSSVETLLSEHEGIGRPGRVAGTRELVIAQTPYIVPYRVRAGVVQILRIYHGARLWPTRF